MIAKFWWGAKEGKRKIHWLSWENLSRTKGERGRVCGISDFNTSLLRKDYWRHLNDGNILLRRVLNGRYYPRSSISKVTSGYNPCYAWRSILSAKDLVERGTR